MRDYKFYLNDIIDAIKKVQKFTKGLSYSDFYKNEMLIDAVIRNLEVIGEATRSIPSEFRKRFPDIPWARMSALRNILIHEYFGVDTEIIWDIVSNKIPELKKGISTVLSKVKKR